MRIKAISIGILTGAILIILFFGFFGQKYFFSPSKIDNQNISNTVAPTDSVRKLPSPTLYTKKPEFIPTLTPTLFPTPTISPTSIPQNTPTAIPLVIPTYADTTPPIVVDISGPWGPTYGEQAVDNFCFLFKGNDNVLSTDADFFYQAKIDDNDWSEWNHNPYPCFSKPSDGAHTFSARVKDKAGNISATSSKNFRTNYSVSP